MPQTCATIYVTVCEKVSDESFNKDKNYLSNATINFIPAKEVKDSKLMNPNIFV